MTHSAPDTREQASAQLPALHLLCNLGWRYLSSAHCLALRGSTREVLLLPRLIETLQSRRFDYKGQTYPLAERHRPDRARAVGAAAGRWAAGCQ